MVHFFYEQPETDSSLKKLLKFFAKIDWNTMNYDEFDQKTVSKQQVISEHHKLLHFSRAWPQAASKQVGYKKWAVGKGNILQITFVGDFFPKRFDYFKVPVIL